MKIDPNAPAFPVIGAPGSAEDYPGMPIRLAIAAQIMAGGAAQGVGGMRESQRWMAENCLAWADALIVAYNRGQP